MGSDCVDFWPSFILRISIHAPRVGSDGGLETAFHTQFLFQSTLPVWGATTMALTEAQKRAFQSTLPVWGATSHCGPFCCQFYYFNPRSPCGERHLFIVYKLTYKHFNPRSPCGERLRGAVHSFSAYPISIHAPRVGSDIPQGSFPSKRSYFNPRSPCGERPQTLARSEYPHRFQSTLPVWGATLHFIHPPLVFLISIHAPRVGSDKRTMQSTIRPLNFNPRSPCGERPGSW